MNILTPLYYSGNVWSVKFACSASFRVDATDNVNVMQLLFQSCLANTSVIFSVISYDCKYIRLLVLIEVIKLLAVSSSVSL